MRDTMSNLALHVRLKTAEMKIVLLLALVWAIYTSNKK